MKPKNAVCIADDSLSPIRESKIKNIATMKSVSEPAKAAGSNAKWIATPIIDKIRKTASKRGRRSILTTGNSTAIATRSTVNATACCKNNAMPNAARNILQKWTR